MSSNIEVKLDVLNQKASPALYSAALSDRPAASFTGRLFVDSNNPSTGIYRDTGTSWVQVADQGAGTTGTLQQVTTNGNTTSIGLIVTAGTFSTISDLVYNTGNGVDWLIKNIPNGPLIRLKAHGTQGGYSNRRGALGWKDNNGIDADVIAWDDSSIITYQDTIISTKLGINTTTAGVYLDVHGTTGVIAQLENTTTQNTLLSFRNQGAGYWSIGNQYNSGSNDFILYDATNFLNRLTITNLGVATLISNLSATKTATYSSGGAYGIYANDNYTIPASTSFGSGGLIFASLQGIQSFTYGGNANYQNSSLNASVVGINQIQFSSTGTITMAQAAGIRTMAAGIFQNQFLGAVNGTIDYLAGLQVLGNYKASSGLLTVTNVYSLLLNNIDDYSTGFTYTNRWGIYQAGSSDNNYFAGKILIGNTTPDSNALKVTGTASISGAITQGGGIYKVNGSFVLTGGLTTTFYTFANSNSQQYYLITLAQQGNGANNVISYAVIYGTYATAYNIAQDNTNPALYLTISMSGLDLQLTTGAGYGSTTWQYNITIIKN